MAQLTVAEAINLAFFEEMRRDKRVFVIGEDIVIDGWGGCTKGLHDEFGSRRVINTAISENAIIGAAVGAALMGMRPVAEIMFSDWLSCGMDQTVNFAATLTYSYGSQVHLPLVVRTTSGHHGGSQHSKSMEAWITHVPGLKVVMPSGARDAKGLLKAAIRDDNPVFYFENRHTYGIKEEVPEDDYIVPIGQADVKREGRDLTIIATGFMVHHALDAAKVLAQEGIDVEIIDPRTLVPLDLPTLVRSARKTGRVLIVHDAWRNCGIGAEIAASLYEVLFGELHQPIERLAHLDVPHPYSPALEDAVRPNREKIAQTVRLMVKPQADRRNSPQPLAMAT
jgi:acetoin:2,6-dichlorophenolindophenol oxidoreductase subunit beta